MHRSGLGRNAVSVYAAALAFTLCASGAFGAFAQAADWPARPIRFVVPLPPGGGADLVARTIGEKLNRSLGQQIIIDNRPGGGTVIGAELVAHAAPDGYTLLLGTATTHAINTSLVKKLPYDPVKDFSPVTLVATLPLILVANAALPADTLRDLIALARKRPGEILFGSTGNGSTIHLAGEMLNTVAKVQMVHVPYRGASLALTELLAGQIQFMFTTIPPALPHLKSGRLKALTVANANRSALLPDVPTTAEGGAPGVKRVRGMACCSRAERPPRSWRGSAASSRGSCVKAMCASDCRRPVSSRSRARPLNSLHSWQPRPRATRKW